MEQIRISAKNLGSLALDTFCSRCFWMKMRCGDKLPYQVFPGIFSSIDSYSKKVTNVYYKKTDVVPSWFESFGELVRPVSVPHHSKFRVVEEETNILLTGAPDEIFQRADGSYFIADYKTARFTGTKEHLLPMYEVQLNVYAYIGNRGKFNPVSGLGLVYYEPQIELSGEELDKVVLQQGFLMPFLGKLLDLKLNPDGIVPPLLRKVREICDLAEPSDSLLACEDCNRLGNLIALSANADNTTNEKQIVSNGGSSYE